MKFPDSEGERVGGREERVFKQAGRGGGAARKEGGRERGNMYELQRRTGKKEEWPPSASERGVATYASSRKLFLHATLLRRRRRSVEFAKKGASSS